MATLSNLRSMVASGADLISWTRQRRKPRHILTAAGDLFPWGRHTIGVNVATRRYLLYAVLPLWLGAGFADYLFHRGTRIAHTSGAHESVIHLLMMTETGIPLLMGLFFEINALVLAIMGTLFVAHEATAYWDVNYAETRRTVTPNEQHAHSFLEVIPFMALSMTVCLNWEQALSLVGRGPERPTFRLRARRPPASRSYIIGILSAVVAFGALPYIEELIRCLLANPTLEATPTVTDSAEGNLRVEASERLD